MKIDGFGRSAGFAALAALAWFPWIFVAGPVLGGWCARAAYFGAVTVAYLAGLAAGPARRLRTVVLAGLAALAVALAARTTMDVVLGLGVVLAAARSVFLAPSAPARAVVLEVALVLGGLWFARLVGGGTLAGTALAIWAFFLMQSLFFLVARTAPASRSTADVDPFDEACRRALVLLERSGV